MKSRKSEMTVQLSRLTHQALRIARSAFHGAARSRDSVIEVDPTVTW